MDNIYIKALKIGTDSLDEGISYDEIIKQLGFKVGTATFKKNFRFWFYTNFFNTYTEENLDKRRFYAPELLDNMKSILSGEAYMNYLDYVELKEARQSAKFAKKIAIISIILTLSAIIVQIIFNLI